MDTPFKLIFSQKNIPRTVNKFAVSEKELYELDDSSIICVQENLSLDLCFDSTNQNDRCYFDLLDIVYNMEYYGEKPYLSPSKDIISIYNTDNEYTGALIPGYYKITIVSENTNFYTWLKITPKQMTEQQWVTMRDEIESTVTGLAQDLLYKRSGIKLNNNSFLPISLLNRLELLNKHFKIWPLSFKTIFEHPKTKIRREYKPVEKAAVRVTDHVSIRKTNTDAKTRARNQIYTVQNTISNHLLENRWLKYFIINISKNIRQIFNELDVYLVQVEKKIQIKSRWGKDFKDMEYIKLEATRNEISKYKAMLSSILNDCNNFLSLEWVQDLPSNKPLQYSLTLHADHNYRSIANFYNDLLIKKYDITLCEKYAYYWKRTDQLYEIWGFLQFIKALSSEELGFTIENGWIYSNLNITDNNIEIPFLEKGETVTLRKDDIVLNLVYDQTINSRDSNLLFTNSGTKRPDLRIDYFKNDEYLQSIIIDFKYRPLFRIWNPNRRTEVMDQLTSYADSFYSKQVFVKTLPNSWRLLRPVQQVWAVYPYHQDNISNGYPRNFDLYELTPNLNNEHIKQSLLTALNTINQTWLDISSQN